MQKIYTNTARAVALIAIAVILSLLVAFKFQHWKIGLGLYMVLGILVVAVIGDICWSKKKSGK